MAQRFGGPNSPGGDPRPGGGVPASGAVRRRPVLGARVNLLFAVPFVFAASAFFRDPSGLILHLGVFGLLIGAAWLTREGVLAQDAYDARRIARRPAFPRKMFGAGLMGLGIGLAAGAGMGLMQGAILGLLGGMLHVLSFGPDPMRDKGIDGVDEFQTERVARAVTEAEKRLTEMTQAIARLNDRALSDRLRDFAGQVRPLLRAVENDPRQLSAARRYLGLYLDGARDASIKFADLTARNPDASARAEYLTLLDDLQRNFAARLASFESADRQALDIEMEVLRERLAREGIRPALPTHDPLDPVGDAIARPAPSTTPSPQRGSDHA
jgi:hypothetical protein